jgi:glycosyltransferase involved in cell wall biosynthesis
LAEVGGPAAVLVDPLNIADIAAAMKRIVNDEKFRTELVALGRERASAFSWSKTVQELEHLIINSVEFI